MIMDTEADIVRELEVGMFAWFAGETGTGFREVADLTPWSAEPNTWNYDLAREWVTVTYTDGHVEDRVRYSTHEIWHSGTRPLVAQPWLQRVDTAFDGNLHLHDGTVDVEQRQLLDELADDGLAELASMDELGDIWMSTLRVYDYCLEQAGVYWGAVGPGLGLVQFDGDEQATEVATAALAALVAAPSLA